LVKGCLHNLTEFHLQIFVILSRYEDKNIARRLFPAVKILEKDLGRRGNINVPCGGYRGRTKKVTPSNLHFGFSLLAFLFPYAGITQFRF
jgi:hypothetical protein